MKLQEKRYTLWLTNKTYIEIKKYAQKNDWTIAQVIRFAIKKLLNK